MSLPPETTILRIYDTVVDDTRWPEVLDEIAHAISGIGAIVFEWENGSDRDRRLHAPLMSGFFEPELMAGYLQRFHELEGQDQDRFEAHSLRHDGIDLIDDAALASSGVDLSTQKNSEALQRFGIGHRAAGLLNKDNTDYARFSVQLGMDRGPLSTAERSYLCQVLPHVAKALDLGRPLHQLSNRYDGVLAAMDHLRTGLCVLDQKGRAMAMNREFTRQLEDYDVFRRTPDGMLHMQSEGDARQMEIFKTQLHRHGSGGARPRKEAIHARDDRYLCVEITPLSTLEEAGTKPLDGFVVVSTDTSRPVHCDVDLFVQAYQLTPAEAALARSIAGGHTNAQIADERGRALATINAQVKSVLSKTDCANRTQFARLLSSFSSDFLLPQDSAI